jgi:hypothetical protein
MQGEFFYANRGFWKVFYRLNPNRISEIIFSQYIVRSGIHDLTPSFWCVGFGPEFGEVCMAEDVMHSTRKSGGNGTPALCH